jgi:3',5'-nucleoside bisphosphate phosphatase
LLNSLIPLDFHCHSTNSDGSYAVIDLLDKVLANGGKYIALTDHDTVDGIHEARQYAGQIGLNFIAGVEISVTWENGNLVHILGLNIDENNQELIKNLNNLRSQRYIRGEKIASNLAKAGIPNALEGALKFCNNPNALSRTHFSLFLTEAGHAKPGKAFEKYLVPGKPGYVAYTWARLSDAVKWITDSGGIAAIAHPSRYKFTRTKLLRLIHDFKACGGRGIEVISSSHSKDDAYNIANIAKQEDLLASIGSDFHGDNQSYHKIRVGLNYPLPPLGCKPVYTEFGITDEDLVNSGNVL